MSDANGIVGIIVAILTFFASLFGGGEMSSTVVTTGGGTAGETMAVHFIDVGQGDSTIIQLPNGENMLIDAGNNGDIKIIQPYLEKLGVEKIDYLIGTHPHADHIGAMDDVIKNYEIGELYMPKAQANTKTYRDVLTAIADKGLIVKTAKSGVVIFDKDGVKAEMLAPCSETYKDLNNYSAVIKLTYNNTAFLFEGDAEDVSENEILQSGADVRADVIKAGHHGSSSSSTQAYIDAVKPTYAVISCGADNDYGHPHRETVATFNDKGIEMLRTDIDGSIVITSDGVNIECSKSGK